MTYSPNSYFRHLPNLNYPSLSNDRTSAYDYEIVKNLFKRAVVREDIFGDIVNFTKYSVEDDERPDQIADDFYGDPKLWWIIATVNKLGKGTLIVPRNTIIRIPNKDRVLDQIENINKTR